MVADRVVKKEDGEKLAKRPCGSFCPCLYYKMLERSDRELKHRATQQQNEPKFQIHDYIESKKHKSSCCGLRQKETQREREREKEREAVRPEPRFVFNLFQFSLLCMRQQLGCSVNAPPSS
ncbi:hypothetical protein FQN60_003631 [Etheostoma spectabile]|uniref:Uncharacterized protein n=1 Tax=Etheostoma spectabile TaxID=54343 RepID=A0A5J5CT34_9PERO|nr:hypothetical protein FQN60_003631 [Etheostoma spectabile]